MQHEALQMYLSGLFTELQMVSLVALFSPGFTISLYSLEKDFPKSERC